MGKQQSKLKRNLITKLANETHFTEEEVRHWYKGFFQDCPNGTLSQKSFIKIYQQFFPEGDSKNFAKCVFRVFDENKDGLIEFEEFMRSLSKTSRGSLDEKLEWAFKLYDLDSDGYVTKEEVFAILDSIQLMMGESKTINSEKVSLNQELANNEDKLFFDSFPDESISSRSLLIEPSPIINIENSKEKINKIFLKLDKNKQNRLSFEEFMQRYKEDPEIVKAFYMYNLN